MTEERLEKEVNTQEEDNAGEVVSEAENAAEETEQEVTAEQQEQNDEQISKEEKKDKKDQQIEELTDRVKRQMAEFENFRKRSEKEKAGMFELGAKSVIEQLLPVVDNFERGLAAVSEEQKADPFVDGMDKIYRQMMEMLTKLEVKPIEAVGNAFDPEFHNAVMHVEDEEAGENTVAEEFLKGYTYKDNVIRHSMVKVAN
ncbi:MAG: nucleotide exchange factor GrpE [Eubacteriales bacterium]|nr:nucleotide exchange factor GrpE [Eubacteriales bacterium]